MAVNTRFARLAVLLLLLPLGTAFAQTNQAPDTATLLKRLEEQDKRIQALEHKIEVLENQQAAASAAAGNTAAAANAAAPVNGSAAAAGQQVAQQPKTPPVPQTTGALPGSPSTAVQGATAAVSQRAATSSGAPGLVTAGSIKAGPTGFSFASADNANIIRFRGNLAVDGRWFMDHVTPESADTFLLRKARPYFEGTIDNDYDFRFTPEFANGKSIILEAFITGRLLPWLAVQAGKFKGPIGLERLQPDQFNRFAELALPSDLVPNRDLGIEVGGDILGGTFGYAIGAFDGVIDGNSTDANPSPDMDSDDGKKDTEGRLFTQPFINAGIPALRGLGFGVAGSYVKEVGSVTSTLLPSYKTSAQNVFFSYRTGTTGTFADGTRSRLTPQAYYFVGPFGALAEYVKTEQDVTRQFTATKKRSGQVDTTAYQVLLSYFLTGEQSTYNSVTPLTTFRMGTSGLGAWELALRYSELTVDGDAFTGGVLSFADPAASARKASAWAAGINWWLNANLKWVLDYEVTRFIGGATGDLNRPNERALTTRFQLTF
jgi:phosphate-selective porin OprO/OprP